MLFWEPVVARKGGQNHRKFGKVFSYLMLVTASMALFMGSTTLLRPVETDPTQVGFEGIFGWMIMELAILTVQVVWHGLITIRNTRRHLANRHSPNVASNVLVILAALVCAYRAG